MGRRDGWPTSTAALLAPGWVQGGLPQLRAPATHTPQSLKLLTGDLLSRDGGQVGLPQRVCKAHQLRKGAEGGEGELGRHPGLLALQPYLVLLMRTASNQLRYAEPGSPASPPTCGVDTMSLLMDGRLACASAALHSLVAAPGNSEAGLRFTPWGQRAGSCMHRGRVAWGVAAQRLCTATKARSRMVAYGTAGAFHFRHLQTRTLTKQVKRLEPETTSHCPQLMRDVFLPPLTPVWVHAHGSVDASTPAAPGQWAQGVLRPGWVLSHGCWAETELAQSPYNH